VDLTRAITARIFSAVGLSPLFLPRFIAYFISLAELAVKVTLISRRGADISSSRYRVVAALRRRRGRWEIFYGIHVHDAQSPMIGLEVKGHCDDLMTSTLRTAGDAFRDGLTTFNTTAHATRRCASTRGYPALSRARARARSGLNARKIADAPRGDMRASAREREKKKKSTGVHDGHAIRRLFDAARADYQSPSLPPSLSLSFSLSISFSSLFFFILYQRWTKSLHSECGA